MRLSELEPKLLKFVDERTFNTKDVAFGDADGVMFLCPQCYADNSNSAVGTHAVICWRPTVSKDQSPGPGRWDMRGTSIDDLTLVGVPTSSVRLSAPCNAHFHITNGEISLCGDSGKR